MGGLLDSARQMAKVLRWAAGRLQKLESARRWPKHGAGQPEGCKRRRQGRREGIEGFLKPLEYLSAQQMAKVWRWVGCYLRKCWQRRWEGFKGRLVPNVAF